MRQCFFETRLVGEAETLMGGYSPVDGVADTIFCGNDCVNEEIQDHRKVEVIGCHGSTNQTYHIGTNLTTVTSTTGEQCILRMNESICGKGKTLFSSNQMRASGHVVEDTPKKYGGKVLQVSHTCTACAPFA